MNIDPKLHRIVAAQPYPLLFATISGAHLYGFPSPDSDFDLRGVHVLPLKEVVGLETKDETVEDARIIEGMEMDIVSHDVRKFFSLLLRKNGYVLEQLFSPLIVQTSPEHEELKAICCPSYRPGRSSASLRGEAGNASSPRPSPSEPKFGLQTEEREKNVRAGSETGAPAEMIRAELELGAPKGSGVITKHHSHHYFGFAETQWKLFLKESPRRVKPLLYVYRVLLTGIWLMRTGVIEANLVTLNESFRLPYIADLIERKTKGENTTLTDGDMAFHTQEYERLRAELQVAFEGSELPEVPDEETRAALNDLLVRVRLK
jgi:predicted nucleotidyltransferase